MTRVFVLGMVVLLWGCGKVETPRAETAPPASHMVYVTNETTGDLSVIDGDRLAVVATVTLGKRPRGIHASPDGKLIYVALSGSPIAGPGVDEDTLPPPDKSADGIGVVDVATRKMLKLVKVGSDPEEFDLSADGKTMYVSNEDIGGASIVDLQTENVVATVKTGEEPEGVKVSPDGKYVWVTSEDAGTVAVINTATRALTHTIPVGRRPRTVAFFPDSARAWVNAENDGTVVLVDAVAKKVVKKVTLGEAGKVKPMFVLLSSDAKTLYVSTGRGKQVFALDADSGKVRGSLEVGARPWGIALSPDGKTLYTANGPSKDVSVVDLATMTVKKRIAMPGSPWGVLVR
jgi:YVTN family beta-propeller protein